MSKNLLTRTSLYSAVMLCIIFAASTLTSYSETLTIDQSIDIALKNNPNMNIAMENVKKGEAVIKQAASGGMPRISIGGTYQRLDKETTANFGGAEIPISKKDNSSVNLTAAYKIDLFGIIKSSKYAAEEGKKAYENYLKQTANDTILDVKSAFYNVLRAQQYLVVQQETVDQLKAHLADAQANYNAGTIAQYDVLRAETQLANAQQGLIAASNGVQVAKSAFNSVLGRPVDTPFELEPPANAIYDSIDLSKCIEAATTYRPEVMAIDNMIKAGDEQVSIAKKNTQPSLNLQWTGTHNFDASGFSAREDSWVAVLAANFSIFDGGYNKSQIEQAKVDANNYRFTKDQILLGVTLDTKQSYLNQLESLERIRAAEKALQQANEAYRLAVVRYQSGVSIQLEVLDAETALTAAKTNHVNAVYDYQIAIAGLERAVGGSEVFSKVSAGK